MEAVALGFDCFHSMIVVSGRQELAFLNCLLKWRIKMAGC